jgi:hypothetical protein
MKTVVSFLLGTVMLFGAATLGLANDKHDKNYWKHHHHRHHQHHHRTNHLSY